MPHVFVHALLDSLKILPWVFAVYVFIEFIERRVSVFKNGKFKVKPFIYFENESFKLKIRKEALCQIVGATQNNDKEI